ncbi:MAG: methyltransferase domain-containing protein [Bacteroidales bacterium]|nr:methyltransferase domain-containing protein [Bacteroidales bacterium]
MSVSGYIYKIFIDPIIAPLHNSAEKYINSQSNIIDVACGTGSFAFRLSKNAASVTGIDMSESMLNIAIKKQKKMKAENIRFLLKDASKLYEYGEKTFDYATISMALHQFQPELAVDIMLELKRIANEIVVIDYAHPLPKNRYGVITYLIERLAGKEHFSNFKKYQSLNGLSSIIEKSGLRIIDSKIRGNGIFVIAKCSS